LHARLDPKVKHFMENRDFNIISPQALPHQVDAIVRRRAAGHVGTIGMSGDVRNRVDHLDENARFRLLRNLLRTLRDFGD
jgi:ATP phosphoribosyltransferase regulatory subunit HisZ